MNMRTIERKPCPFCGGAGDHFEDGNWHWIECSDCEARMRHPTWEGVHAWWNRRPDQPTASDGDSTRPGGPPPSPEGLDVLAVLRRVDRFIRNGIDAGYIRMPTIESDPALQIPDLVACAIDALAEREKQSHAQSDGAPSSPEGIDAEDWVIAAAIKTFERHRKPIEHLTNGTAVEMVRAIIGSTQAQGGGPSPSACGLGAPEELTADEASAWKWFAALKPGRHEISGDVSTLICSARDKVLARSEVAKETTAGMSATLAPEGIDAKGLDAKGALAWALAESVFTVTDEEAREIIGHLKRTGYAITPAPARVEADPSRGASAPLAPEGQDVHPTKPPSALHDGAVIQADSHEITDAQVEAEAVAAIRYVLGACLYTPPELVTLHWEEKWKPRLLAALAKARAGRTSAPLDAARDDSLCAACGAPWGTKHSETCRNVPVAKGGP
jgi:hypothetical protein